MLENGSIRINNVLHCFLVIMYSDVSAFCVVSRPIFICRQMNAFLASNQDISPSLSNITSFISHSTTVFRYSAVFLLARISQRGRCEQTNKQHVNILMALLRKQLFFYTGKLSFLGKMVNTPTIPLS